MKNRQNGFALVEGLLLAIAIALIVFVGYYVWHTQQQTDKTLTTAANTSDSTPALSNPKTATNPDESYTIVIQEWGVQAKYSGNLTLDYTLDSKSSPQTVGFSSAELAKADPSCSGDSTGGLISRYRSTEHYLAGDDGVDSGKTAAQYAATLNKDAYAHVGDYYYFYTGVQGVCSSKEAAQDLQSQTKDAVISVLDNLVAIPN